MSEPTIMTVEARHVAVVAERVRADALSQRIPALLDRVFTALGQGVFEQGGSVMVIYRHVDLETGHFDLEAGVEAAGPFEARDGVAPTTTPACTVARLVHPGDYGGLPAAHQRLYHWAKDNGHTPTGLNWEIYSDWSDDPDELRTEVLYLLA
jgi:effector-binding domain-containing protein